MLELISKNWHHLPEQSVFDILKTRPDWGLDEFEVKHRQARVGLNEIRTKPPRSALKRFLLQFHQPLIYILIASGLITAAIKGPVDASVILGVVLLNAVIGYLQESKAVQALEALSKTVTTEASVLRAGEKIRIPSTQLVPGDIVQVQSGDKIPADLRLLEVRGLQVDESALTGESVPVFKERRELALETPLGNRINMAYSTSLVASGQGRGVVVGTGMATEIGKISHLIQESPEMETPLTKRISHFSHKLLYAILGLAGLTFVIGIFQGHSPVELFIAAVALAVAAIPEGLPAVVTITLAIGVHRMAKRGAVVRRLPAVETLGSVSVICSDKTGTITKNQMTVQAVFAGGKHYEISGSGYEPAGEITLGSVPLELSAHPGVTECLRAGLLCNDSRVRSEDGLWKVFGDPTEAALQVSAQKAGLQTEVESKTYPRVDLIPFESEHQYMAVLTRHPQGGGTAWVKGAAEVILKKCSSQKSAASIPETVDPVRILKEVEALASGGLRVLAFARKDFPHEKEKIHPEDLEAGLVFLGLQGMIDPPRPEAVQAIAKCRKAGIAVKMITGDHAVTAKAIAAQVGLAGEGVSPRVLTGQDLESLKDRELIQQARETQVFARVSPEQKLRLVEALQASSLVVAMTGDGVNDAPALKQADIGVAMGVQGTEVAKEAAEMILTDDNFATIEAAVEEGRVIFDNLMKFILWILPTNLGQGLVILTAVAMNVPLPILPVQILWINMTTAVLLGLTLTFEAPEPNIMDRPPRASSVSLMTPELMRRLALVGCLLLGGAFGIFEWELARGVGEAAARTAAVSVFILGQSFYLLNCRSLTESVWSIGFFSNKILLAGIALMFLAHGIFIYAPWMNAWFHSAPVDGLTWAVSSSVGIMIFFAVGVEKMLARPRKKEG